MERAQVMLFVDHVPDYPAILHIEMASVMPKVIFSAANLGPTGFGLLRSMSQGLGFRVYAFTSLRTK